MVKKTLKDKIKKTKKRVAKAAKKDAKDIGKAVYKKARNGRVYKLVNGRPRFVSKDEAAKNGFGKEEAKKK